MMSFDLKHAATPREAAALLGSSANARVIAGGTNILDLMKNGIEAPTTLIDINGVGLDRIERTADGGVRIGALVRNTDLAADGLIRTRYAVLSRAILAGASGQIRNMATTAGNILQRTRCLYFYDCHLPCNKRASGSGCGAARGSSREAAIVGVSSACIATHPSDMAVALRVLDARVETIDARGRSRRLTLTEFYRFPGATPHVETSLQKDEIVIGVVLPKPVAGRHFYRKVRDRASYAFATVSIAGIVGRQEHRFAFGGVAAMPWRVEAAEVETRPARIVDRVFADARPTDGNAFKLPLLRGALAGEIEA